MLRVGILGTGTMGRVHASSYSEIEGVKVTAFADLNPAYSADVGKKYNARIVQSADEIINNPDIDIVDICLPTPFHKENVLKALKAGKHVFCEKPIARTIPDAEEIVNATEKAKSKFMVGHVVRFFPDFVTVKQLLDAGKVGTPGIARSSRMGHFPHGAKNWYGSEHMSGGVVLDMIIHDFDFMNWYFGKPKRVFARGLYKSNFKDFDYALVMIRYKSGVIAHVEGSWAEPSGFNVKIEVSGNEGLVEMSMNDTMPLTLSVKSTSSNSSGVAVPESPLLESPYTSELRHFIQCIQTNKKPSITAEDALDALKVGLAALQSIESGKPVTIN